MNKKLFDKESFDREPVKLGTVQQATAAFVVQFYCPLNCCAVVHTVIVKPK